MTDHPNDSIRMFRNEEGGTVFPDGLVKVIRPNHVESRLFLVEYVDPPAGFDKHQFYVDDRELTRISAPVLQARDFWIVNHPKVPTFYLNGIVQGIVDAEHAARIAGHVAATPIDVSQVARVSDIVS